MTPNKVLTPKNMNMNKTEKMKNIQMKENQLLITE